RKAFAGQLQGLLDPGILARKAKEEDAFRKKVRADADLKQEAADAWDKVAAAQKTFASFERSYYLLERGDAFDGELFRIARHLVRLAAERPRPRADRLAEYGAARLASLEFQLFSPAPISPELERARLAGALTFLAEQLGGEHPQVVKVLVGKSP